MDLENQYDEETMDFFYEECDIEKIFSQLSRILKELNKIVPGSPENTRNIGNNIIPIINDIDKNCLVRLSSTLNVQLPAAANQMAQQASFGSARRCIPLINNVLNFLRDEFYMMDEEGDEDNQNENQNNDEPTIMTGGKQNKKRRKTKTHYKKTIKRTNKKRSYKKRRTHKRRQ